MFTGKVTRFNSTQEDKKKSLREVFLTHNHNQSFAFGDSIGDIGMFKEVEYPICVNASDKLREIALKNKWILSDKNNILKITSKLLK